jgi:hypothetical protein
LQLFFAVLFPFSLLFPDCHLPHIRSF